MSLPSIFQYSPKTASVLWKAAAEEPAKKEPSLFRRALPIAAGGALGTIAGYTGGRLAGHLLDRFSEAQTGIPIQASTIAIPGAILGALAGRAYAAHQEREIEALKHVAEEHRNRRSGRGGGK